MSLSVTLVIALVLVAILGLGVFLLLMGGVPLPGSRGLRQRSEVTSNLRTLVNAQRQAVQHNPGSAKAATLALAAAAEGDLGRKKISSAQMTLDKRLRYAKLPFSPIQFRALQVMLAILFFIPAYRWLKVPSWAVALVIPPAMLSSFVDRRIKKQFNRFDQDYPVLLMQYVSLLKTGMNAIQGLEAAGKGLEPESLCRAEIELMIERLRLGLTEEQAIGAFGEDVAHPELELFVQSLILSRRVGGTLSLTIERLARQVRKRSEFRKKAVAAVGMERGSLYAIAVIMALLMVYLCFTSPELVFPAFSHPLGQNMIQGGFALIIFGFYWSNKVTNIKV